MYVLYYFFPLLTLARAVRARVIVFFFKEGGMKLFFYKEPKGKKREEKKPRNTRKNMENTDEHIHKNKTKIRKKNKQKAKKPHPGQGKEGGYGGSKGQRVASPEGDRGPLEEMTCGFLWGKPQALTQEAPNLGNGFSS